MITVKRTINLNHKSLLANANRGFNFVFAQDYNPEYKKNIERQHMIKNDKEYRFAIVGTGPAGFYMAKNLIKNVPNCRVDLFDRNPHPYGLIRNGVAPDHQAMKRIEKDFSGVSASPNVEFFGNVWVGDKQEAIRRGCHHLTMQDLRQNYSATILAYGACSDRELGLDQEHTTKGVMPSRRLVDWYNGSYDCDLQPDEFDLEKIKHLGVIGNGNVACDITRMLLRSVDDFANCDAPSHVLDSLRKSQLNTIQMVGRRGVCQSAFTITEIKALCNLPNISLYMLADEFNDSINEASQTELLTRAIQRRTEYLHGKATFIESAEHYHDILSRDHEKKLILRYLRNPVEIIKGDDGHLKGVRLERMQLEGEPNKQRAVASQQDYPAAYSLMECQALVKSIGYKSIPISADVPFDTKRNVIPHSFGCVKDPETDQLQVGLYVAGWIKRGPVGIIDATLRDSMETFRMIKNHIEHDLLPERKTTVSEIESVIKGECPTDGDNLADAGLVTCEGWLKVDQEEKARGARLNKIREKIPTKQEMIDLATRKSN